MAGGFPERESNACATNHADVLLAERVLDGDVASLHRLLATCCKPTIERFLRHRPSRCQACRDDLITARKEEGLDAFVKMDDRMRLYEAAQSIANARRRLVVLGIYFLGYGVGQMAESLRTTEYNVSKLKRRGLDDLRDILKQHSEERSG